ncbi:hypothetical protein ACFT8V_19960 [Streptomyces griseoincarnatus]
MPPHERDCIRPVFLPGHFRSLFADSPAAARACVAALRRETGPHRDDSDLYDPVGELGARSFLARWPGAVRGW